MSKSKPCRWVIAAFRRMHVLWLELEKKAVDADISNTCNEITQHRLCGRPVTADAMRPYLRNRVMESQSLGAKIHQLKESHEID